MESGSLALKKRFVRLNASVRAISNGFGVMRDRSLTGIPQQPREESGYDKLLRAKTSGFHLVNNMAGDLGFIGVSTQHSLIQKLFPLWVDVLGLGEAKLRGFDHPPGVSLADMRSQVEQLQEDSSLAGALVTTHKVVVWELSLIHI